jgi:hypothetical protein
MTVPPDSQNHRIEWSAMILELQTNRSVLNKLSKYYAKFRFTGGNVSADRWSLAAIILYLNRPFAADHVITAEVERYRQLAEAIMDLGRTIAESGPKSLQCRFDVADTFDRLSAEVRALGSTLEFAMTKLLDKLGPSAPFLEKRPATGLVELEVSPMDGVVST